MSDAYLRELLRNANPELFTGRLRARARKAVARLRQELKDDPSMADLIASGMVLTAAREALAGRKGLVPIAEHLANRTEGRVVTLEGDGSALVQVTIYERCTDPDKDSGGGSGEAAGA